MLRVPLNKAYIHRTVRPLYGWTQMTPKAVFLDPAWDRSVNIFPGMSMMKTSGDNVTLLNNTGVPYGLAALYVGGDGIDEPLDAGVNAYSVWVMDPDAEMQVTSPAFDDTLNWAGQEAGDGTIALVYAQTAGANRGKLVITGTSGASSRPVGRLIKVIDSKNIVVAGLVGTV